MQQKKRQKYRNRKSETRPKTLNLANIVKFAVRFRFLLNNDKIKALNPWDRLLMSEGKKFIRDKIYFFLMLFFCEFQAPPYGKKTRSTNPKPGTWKSS